MGLLVVLQTAKIEAAKCLAATGGDALSPTNIAFSEKFSRKNQTLVQSFFL